MCPPGDKETTDFTPLAMVILSIEEEVEEEESGSKKDTWIDLMKVSEEEIYQNNNTRAQQPVPTERSQPVRQDDVWSSPTNIERREDTERHQMPQVPPSEVPPPAEERLFTNWSSENTPRERIAQ